MSKLNKALADFKAGKFVIVTDDETRENEGDLFILALALPQPRWVLWSATHLALFAQR